MKRLIVLFLLCSSLAEASIPLTGEITELWINDGSYSNVAMISMGTSFSSPCYSTDLRYLILDFSQSGMKEAYALALAAYMSGIPITMAGSGSCHGIVEKLQYINVIK